MKRPRIGFICECAKWNGTTFIGQVRMMVESAKAMSNSKYIHAWKEEVRGYVELGFEREEVEEVLRYFEYNYA